MIVIGIILFVGLLIIILQLDGVEEKLIKIGRLLEKYR